MAQQLREAGALIGLDDYGATEMDIMELDFFPLDFVKLDRSYSINKKHLDSSFHKKMIKIAKKRGWDVYGTEFTEEAVKICKEKGIKKADSKTFFGMLP